MHWIGLGLAQARMGDSCQAIQSLERARELMPRYPGAYLALAQLERTVGDDRRALSAARLGLRLANTKSDLALHKVVALHAAKMGEDDAVVEILSPIIENATNDADVWFTLLNSIIRKEGERAARALVWKAFREHKALMPMHSLMQVYDVIDRRRNSRLINRYLMRVWPHSDFHARRYALELARAGYSWQADKVLRQEYSRNPSQDLERVYCERAYLAGEFAEASRRFMSFQHRYPIDVSADLMLGYSLANTEGLAAAERHFHQAAGAINNEGALVGMAHMAMRARDNVKAARCWATVRLTYPYNVDSVSEEARAYFRSGDLNRAIFTCEAWQKKGLPSQTVDELHAWLIMQSGRFDQALAYALDVGAKYGPSWSLVEVIIETSGLLGKIAEFSEIIMNLIPRVDNLNDANHLYSVFRLFRYFDCAAEVLSKLLSRSHKAIDLAWAWPYILQQEKERETNPATFANWTLEKAEADHISLAKCVTDVNFKKWADLLPFEVARLLDKGTLDRPQIHIINMFEQSSGGSELHALDLGGRLQPYADVTFWAPVFPHPMLRAHHGVNIIDPSAGNYPGEGVLVFIGVYFSPGSWLRVVRARRVIVLYNTFDAVRLSGFVRSIYKLTGCKVELLFCSEMMRAEAGLPGIFEPSPIDLLEYRPVVKTKSASFIIGRHSRDVPEKHDPRDGDVYKAMVELGAQVQLLGATCMRGIFPITSSLELLPARQGGIEAYLGGLDVFFYRTGTWIEPWGRVVVEAMAMGLPVVVHERGGYAEIVRDGIDGFVFRTTAEAIDRLTELRYDSDLRRCLGANARKRVEQVLGGEELRRLIAVYLI